MFEKIKRIFLSSDGGKTYKAMDDAEFVAYHQKLYADLPAQVKSQGVEILRTKLPKWDLPLMKGQIKEYGTVVWMTKIQEHFGWGMAVRNLLRENGLKDDVLPSENWDDYYVLLVEDACKCESS